MHYITTFSIKAYILKIGKPYYINHFFKKKKAFHLRAYFAFLICWSPLVRALGISRTVG